MAIASGQEIERSYRELEHRMRGINMPTHPSTIRLIAYWQACEARGGMRMGRDVPASDIAALMPDLTVAEPVRDWADARIRLAGSAMAGYFGHEADGALMSEAVTGERRAREMLLAGARTAIARNRPGIIEQVLVDNRREVLRQELTALPIYAPDSNARWILLSFFSF
ncbi:MAG TPA: PAS domain-containing protein [Rhizomicrobium sp.]|nr:PAS domain-containing protein [Rhizomicrobium sp.]